MGQVLVLHRQKYSGDYFLKQFCLPQDETIKGQHQINTFTIGRREEYHLYKKGGISKFYNHCIERIMTIPPYVIHGRYILYDRKTSQISDIVQSALCHKGPTLIAEWS